MTRIYALCCRPIGCELCETCLRHPERPENVQAAATVAVWMCPQTDRDRCADHLELRAEKEAA